MKILWVKAGGLIPPDTGGKIRSYNILRELARKHSVTFFSFYGAHKNDLHPGLKGIFDHVICIPLDLPAPKGFGELCDYVGRIFSREPYGITKYCRPQVRHQLLRLLERGNYDVILCDFLAAAGVIPWAYPSPKVLFTHNVEAVIWQRHYEMARNPLWKALTRREWRAMQAAEEKYLRLADHVLAVSENDRDSFATFLDPSRVTVIPTGVDTEYFRPSPQEEAPDSLVFAGSMDWLPNDDAILYFVKEILPLVRREIPQVSLCVVGRKPSSRMQDLAAKEKKVHLTGWVDDIRPYLAGGAVCIVPLRIGGGTRLKIFEAMGMAKAVVSTSIGAEGLPVRPGQNILLADEPGKFAGCVVSLLRDPTQRMRLGQASRKLVEENYSWARVAKGFAEVLTNVAASHSPRAIVHAGA